eukprot:NODE_137_length_16306_cov_0.462640.p4 type:complete len:379 gc:universal NODE_137_length_16306_cov_0.462640:451-1587(+)
MNITENVVLTRKQNENTPGKSLVDNQKIDWDQEIQITDGDSRILKIRKLIFNLLESPDYNFYSKSYAIIFAIIIVGSVLQFALESVYSLNNTDEQIALMNSFDAFFSIVFSIDYFTKIVSCPNYFKLPKLLMKPFWIIDLLSILPFYIDLATEGSSNTSVIRIVRIVRIFRIFRLLKASRNIKEVQLVFESIKRSYTAILMLFFMVGNCLLFYGSFIYYFELSITTRDPNTNILMYSDGILSGKATGFQSIPDTMWFGAVTITTVGYGDMYPITPLGKIFAACMAITGLLVIAYPVTILSSNMGELYREHRLLKQSRIRKNHRVFHYRKEELALIQILNECLIRNNNLVSDMSSKLTNMLYEHEDIQICIDTLKGIDS